MGTKGMILVAFLGFVVYASCHPTMYKINDKKLFEPVIPLPIYQVSSGINIGGKDNKYAAKPIGPISLLTSANYKKKAYSKPKPDDISIVKEVSNKEFQD